MRKKILISGLILVVCTGIFFLCRIKKDTPEAGIFLKDRYSREAYLNIKGWDVTEESSMDVVIPCEFTGIYSDYAALQEKQGLPLSKYKGKKAQRFIYTVKNYGGDVPVKAELVISGGKLVSAALVENVLYGKLMPVTM